MPKLGLIAFAARLASRILPVRRGTWIALGLGLVIMGGLFVWMAASLLSWSYGQARAWVDNPPPAVSDAARRMLERIDPTASGASEALRAEAGAYLPALMDRAHGARDVSGTDLGPVPRYPGKVRVYWHREGKRVTVEYEGRVEYAAVLDHYAQGFSARGFAADMQSANREAETHLYTRGKDSYLLTVARKPGGIVSARIETTLQ